MESIWALLFPVILIVGNPLRRFHPVRIRRICVRVRNYYRPRFVYKELDWKVFLRTLRDSSHDIGVIMILVSLSGIFGYGIVYDSIPQTMAAFLVGVTSNPYLLLLIVILLLVFCGMFVETTVIALLLTPHFVAVWSPLQGLTRFSSALL